ncbi:MAG: hypothetical protein WA215_11910 [Candidatus Cybelea sp.]
MLNHIGYKPIADAPEAKGCPAVDEAVSALVREGFGGSFGDRLAFPLGYNAEHIDDEATGGGLRVEGFAH